MDDLVQDLGRVVTVNGAGADARLFKAVAATVGDENGLTIGRLVGIRVDHSLVVAVVVSMSVSKPDPDDPDSGHLVAAVDFMGEIKRYGTADAIFQRGVSTYPTIGNTVRRLVTDDVAVIHRIESGDTIEIGRLRLDSSVPPYINFDELLRKHFAVLGTTGVGKSTAVALILQEILNKKTNLRIFLVDPHNEYGNCFGELAHVIDPEDSAASLLAVQFRGDRRRLLPRPSGRRGGDRDPVRADPGRQGPLRRQRPRRTRAGAQGVGRRLHAPTRQCPIASPSWST